MNKSIALILFLACIMLCGCNPDKLEIEIYSADLIKASAGEAIEVPVTAYFSIIGDDTENLLDQTTLIVKKYLNPKAEIIKTKGELGDSLVVKCTIPLGTAESLKKYLAVNPALLVLVLENQGSYAQINLAETVKAEALNKELTSINLSLGFELPAKNTFLRITGDTEKVLAVTAPAVFVDGKANYSYKNEISKRKAITLEYRGGTDSVYSELPVMMRFQALP